MARISFTCRRGEELQQTCVGVEKIVRQKHSIPTVNEINGQIIYTLEISVKTQETGKRSTYAVVESSSVKTLETLIPQEQATV